ncbi:hypothetical protein D6D54_00770 [Spiroplasma poulsonii]|uniref:Uncharacterized protein n=1 Tax=Spiroplasma poulsonii TaxID=2138 RepID=A0A433ET02_9MOLU|nr:hypothetical protein [Spiroplasma poulsonii]RUP78046.1 hypothetical protein D6D54_00770 [Spiroplasma poulsonii]
MMNNYILCYRSEQGNRPCKNPRGEYIIGIDKQDVDINSTEYWEYYKNNYGENNLVICKVKNLDSILESKK